MIYTIFALAHLIFFFTIADMFNAKKIEKIEDRRERSLATLNKVQVLFRNILDSCKVTYEVEGMENLTNIPKEEGVMFVGNHRSYFDVVIGYTLVDRPTGFIAKIEMQKIKPMARWMDYAGCLMIDRNDLRQSLKVILTAIKYVKAGISIYIYPEGTRSHGETEEEMLPFKEGSFKIAEKTGCKIVPISMIHTREVLESHFPFIHPQHVKVKIGKPILMSELTEEQKSHIGSYTRDKVIEGIKELKAKEA